jgi:hypothetical protein
LSSKPENLDGSRELNNICGWIAPEMQCVFNAQPKSGSTKIYEGIPTHEDPYITQISTEASERVCKCGNSTPGAASAQPVCSAKEQPSNAGSAQFKDRLHDHAAFTVFFVGWISLKNNRQLMSQTKKQNPTSSLLKSFTSIVKTPR